MKACVASDYMFYIACLLNIFHKSKLCSYSTGNVTGFVRSMNAQTVLLFCSVTHDMLMVYHYSCACIQRFKTHSNHM